MIKIIRTDFKDLYLIEYNDHTDRRGSLCELFRQDFLKKEINFMYNFCQDNLVKSSKMVLRGLHFQNPPFAQSKLISVINGEIFDVAVDLRKNSKTYGKYFSLNLNSKSNKSILIPRGFAHGYLSLSEDTIVHYKVDNYYNAFSEDGIRFDDARLNIDWGYDNKDLIISKKDCNYNPFKW